LAVLIDADNTSARHAHAIFEEIVKLGEANVRRIYGDFSGSRLSGWNSAIQSLAILQHQQRNNTTGKNAADIALVIDAMDLLHTGTVDGFCIVSSDSDYTRLATRIREGGLFVMGIGRMQTPNSLVNACEVFVYTENLTSSDQTPDDRPLPPKPSKWTGTVSRAVETAIETGIEEDGWVMLSIVGSQIRKLDPAFDPRTYGFSRLSLLVKSEPDQFETSERAISGHKQLFIRRSSK